VLISCYREENNDTSDHVITESNFVIGEAKNCGIGRIIEQEKYSSLIKLLRVTAWCFRFINNVQKKQKNKIEPVLTVAELKYAKDEWIKFIQTVYFGDVFTALKIKWTTPARTRLAVVD
jgi:hypothetical protein